MIAHVIQHLGTIKLMYVYNLYSIFISIHISIIGKNIFLNAYTCLYSFWICYFKVELQTFQCISPLFYSIFLNIYLENQNIKDNNWLIKIYFPCKYLVFFFLRVNQLANSAVSASRAQFVKRFGYMTIFATEL